MLYRTVIFMKVTTIIEAALMYKWTDVSKETFDFCFDYVPKLKLTYAWSVNDIATGGKWNQTRSGGRMFPFFGVAADFVNFKVERWIHQV